MLECEVHHTAQRPAFWMERMRTQLAGAFEEERTLGRGRRWRAVVRSLVGPVRSSETLAGMDADALATVLGLPRKNYPKMQQQAVVKINQSSGAKKEYSVRNGSAWVRTKKAKVQKC